MNERSSLIVSSLGEERVKVGEKLSYHTFTKVGGPAAFFYIATNQNELVGALDLAYDLKIPFLVIGGGTKILVSSEGFTGLVIKNRTSLIKISGIKGKVGRKGVGVDEAVIEVDSGVSIGKINEFLKEQGLLNLNTFNTSNSSLGGSLFIDNSLQDLAQTVKVWEDGEVYEIETIDLRRHEQIILSVVLKIKAN